MSGWKRCGCGFCYCRHEVQTRYICDRCEHGFHRMESLTAAGRFWKTTPPKEEPKSGNPSDNPIDS